ncbi:Transcription factor, MADS-box [Corchorus capsularis]|uniref:Transcription factor, MADS-box n=1 Tax=Corchorus capsularis TaxID=210143 RepID=A0A1R3H9J8_COCAP|nr:Transcription factor, MADS-box [Corchorus capsularis]
MGRRTKQKLERLENMKARQAKYSKRKRGIVKKVKEIAVLCDVDVALLLISPTEKPTVVVGKDKDLSTVIERMSRMRLEEREDRCWKKCMENPTTSSSRLIQETHPKSKIPLHEDQLSELKETIAKKNKILSDWRNPTNIEDLAQLNIMEEHIQYSEADQLEQQGREEGAEGTDDLET